MKYTFSIHDIKFYFGKNRKLFLGFLCCFFVGIIVGVIVILSSNSYIKLLRSNDNILYNLINGHVDFAELFFKLFSKNFLLMFLIFILNLYYYTGLLSFVIFSYQTTLLFLFCVSIIGEFGFSGVMTVLFLVVPINLINLLILVIFSVFCLERNLYAHKFNYVWYGITSKRFLISIGVLILINLLSSFVINLILVIVLRSGIFALF